MTEYDDPIVSTTLTVRGVKTEDQVREALQALFDIFAELDLGQATFEVTDADATRLIVKHKQSVTPDRDAIAQVLAATGDFRLVD
ncbi:MAG TPA: hypothetical protein VNQ48_00465 [Microbacteriaceae bacterium]|nr:hypothetical protein [Microbacteriaceae bacterium]